MYSTNILTHNSLCKTLVRNVVDMSTTGSNARKFQKWHVCCRHGFLFHAQVTCWKPVVVTNHDWNIDPLQIKKMHKKISSWSNMIPLSDVKMQEKEFEIANLLLIPKLKN